MKKLTRLLIAFVLLICMIPASTFAGSETEYNNRGVYYTDSRTKEALDKCGKSRFQYTFNGETKPDGFLFDLFGATIDIYDDLLIDNSGGYMFRNGTIVCHNCRAFYLNRDDILLNLYNITIIDGDADGANYADDGEGGAIYVDGGDCIIKGNDCTIKNCNAEYGGAIAVSGHDCTINDIVFSENTASSTGGNDLYVFWGDCKVNNCKFYSSSPNANITADTYFDGCNITKKMCVGDVHQVVITNSTGSFISEGNLWIVIAVSLFALGGIVSVIIVKKKKKTV